MSDDTPHPTLPNDKDAGASRPKPGGTVKLSTAGLEAGLFDDTPAAGPARSHGATMAGRQVVTSLARPIKARDLMEEVAARPRRVARQDRDALPRGLSGGSGAQPDRQGAGAGEMGRWIPWACASLAWASIATWTTRPQAAARAWCCAPMWWARRWRPRWRACPGARPARWSICRRRGARFDQAMARRFAAGQGMVILCGRFEGVDQRVLEHYGIEEVSAGDFVLTGGELAAQIVLDATVRLRPEVLGNSESTEEESFSNGLLEYPQYTRPAEWQGRTVPEVLTSGNHKKIAEWRREESEKLTAARRPDLWAAHVASRPPPKPKRQRKKADPGADQA